MVSTFELRPNVSESKRRRLDLQKGNSMKALVLTAIKTPLEPQDRSPLDPQAGEVVIQLKAAALNRRDYWITQGMYPGINPPVVLGSDGAGVVVKCGAGVDERWQGREVIADPGFGWGADSAAQANDFTILGVPRDGTFAEEVVVPVEQLHDKPNHLDFAHAAALPLAGVTAYRALFTQGELKAGESVLISGVGGGVATLATQFALAAGATVQVTSSSQTKIDRAVELGASGGLCYTDIDWRKQWSGAPPNLIIDSAGGSGYADLIQLAAPGARIVSYGATQGVPEKLDLFKVFWKQLRLIGSTMGSPADFAAMLNFAGQHKIEPVIDQVYPLESANEALAAMQSSPQFGKYVLSM